VTLTLAPGSARGSRTMPVERCPYFTPTPWRSQGLENIAFSFASSFRPSPGLCPGVAHHAGGTSSLLHADPLAEPGARIQLLAWHDLAGEHS
jgi:hypothetical protein